MELYGNSKKISKNYNKIFQKEFKSTKINVKSISDWLQKLNNIKLKSMVKNPLKKKNEINKSKNEENIAKVENGTINNNNTKEKNSTNYEHPESHPPSNEKRIDDTKISSIENNIISSQNHKQESKNEELLKKINEKNNIYHHNEIINDNSTLPEIEIKNNNNIDFRIKEDESYDQCKKKNIMNCQINKIIRMIIS